jgi:hypothetical protein
MKQIRAEKARRAAQESARLGDRPEGRPGPHPQALATTRPTIFAGFTSVSSAAAGSP